MRPLSWATTPCASSSPSQVRPALIQLLCQEPADSSLEGVLHKFMEAGLSDSTRHVYKAGWNRFLSFTRAFSRPATPTTEESAILFAAYLGSEGFSVSTIESYLAALRHFHVVSDLVVPSLSSTHRI